MSAEGRDALPYRWARGVLVVIGSVAVLGLAVLVVLILGHEWRSRPDPVAEVQAAPDAERFTVGGASTVPGTSLVQIAVGRGNNDNPYPSGPEREERNIILLDPATGRSRRLLPDNRHRLVQSHFLPAEATRPGGLDTTTTGAVPPTRFVLLEVEREHGRRDLLAGRIEGGAMTTVLRDAQQVSSVWMLDSTRAAVLAFERGRLTYRTIDLTRLAASRPMVVEVGR